MINLTNIKLSYIIWVLLNHQQIGNYEKPYIILFIKID